MINLRTNSSQTTVYRSPDTYNVSALPASAVGNSFDSPLTNGETDYYSFDINTAGWSTGGYDISGKIKSSSGASTSLDFTGAGITGTAPADWWQTNWFTLQAAQPLPAPSVSVSNITQTGASVSWSWSGGDANADHAELALAQTDTLDGNTIALLVAGSSSAGYLYSFERGPVPLQDLPGVGSLKPGQYYRANIRYIAAPGFTGTTASNDVAFQTTPMSAPTAYSPSVSNMQAAFDWSNVTGANLYRLQVRKAGTSWPGSDTASASANVPVNILFSGSTNSDFVWNSYSYSIYSSANVYALPIPGQSYDWRVKAAYDGTVDTAYTTGSSFTIPSNALPTISGTSASSGYGAVTINFTPNDADDSQLRYDLHLYANPAGSGAIGGTFGISQPFAAIKGTAQTQTFTKSDVNGMLVDGTTYYVRIKVFDPAFEANGTNYREVFVPFVFDTFAPNPLGVDVESLHGMNVRGPIFLGRPDDSITANSWKAFYIKQYGVTLAQCYVGVGKSFVLNDAAWRDPYTGAYIAEWSDIIANTSTLTVVGEDTAGIPYSSAPFTVTPQEELWAEITPPTGLFPTFNFPQTPTFTATVWPLGGLSYKWFFVQSYPRSTAVTYAPTFSQQNVYALTLRVADNNGNVTFARYIAPIGMRADRGDPATNGSGSALVGPVDVATGNVHLSFDDFTVPCYGTPFLLTRSYDSWMKFGSAHRWHFNLEDYGYGDIFADGSAGFNGRGLYLIRGDGRLDQYFLDDTGEYRPLNPGNFDLVRDNGMPGSNGRLYVYEPGGSVRTYIRSSIYVPTTGFSASLWILSSIKDARGNGMNISYNYSASSHLVPGLPRIASVSDAAGRSFSFVYDSSGHIQRVTDPIGRYVQYTWDGNHNVTDFRDLNGNTTHYDYRTSDPGLAQLSSILLPRGNRPISSIGYDTEDRAVTLGDGESNTTSFTYNGSSTLVTPPVSAEKTLFELSSTTRAITQITQAYGTDNIVTQMRYLTANNNNSRIADFGLVQQSVDPANRTTSISYDSSSDRGLIQSVTTRLDNQNATSSYGWQEASAMPNLFTANSLTSAAGRNSTSVANAYGEITQSTDPGGNSTFTTYNGLGLPQTIRDPLNRATTFGYDSYGNVTSITDHTNAVTQIFYAEPQNGFPTRRLDRLSKNTYFTYDNLGRVLRETNHLNLYLENTYNANGMVSSIRDRRGNYTNLGYDNRDLLISAQRTAPVNGVSTTLTETIGYNSMGRVSSLTNARGNINYRYYNSRGLLASTVNGAGETVLRLTYNNDGTVASQITGSGTDESTVSFGYTDGRRTSVTDAFGTTLTNYNKDNQIISQRDARNTWTSYDYDTAGRLAVVTGPIGNPVRAYYDAIGRPTEVRDPMGHSTTYVYQDSQRRVDMRDHSQVRTWTYLRDAEDQLITEQFPDGRSFSYQYDDLNRLDYVSYGGGRYADPSYDADNNMIRLDDHLGSTLMAYDSMNRLASVTDPFSQTISYLYDAASNLTRITYPGSGKVVNYTFDAAERMKTIMPWAGGTFTYTWRSDSRPSRLVHGNGNYTDYAYDAAARLTGIVARYSNSTAFINHAMQLDANSNITNISGDQPTAPPADPSKLMTYDESNRLLTANGSAASTDAAGRLSQLPTTIGGTATWDARDSLASYQAGVGSPVTTYSYNGLSQRLTRSQGGNTTRYVLDQNQALPAVLVENNGSNTAQRYYIHGLGLLASIDANGQVQNYHFSHRGDTLALTSGNSGNLGTITESYGYSPYGVTTATNPSSNPFRFAGQFGVTDEGNGLHFMRARYYAAAAQRFLSMDQLEGIPTDSQSLNRFGYVANNPLKFYDPSGRVKKGTTESYNTVVTNFGYFNDSAHTLIEATVKYGQGAAYKKAVGAAFEKSGVIVSTTLAIPSIVSGFDEYGNSAQGWQNVADNLAGVSFGFFIPVVGSTVWDKVIKPAVQAAGEKSFDVVSSLLSEEAFSATVFISSADLDRLSPELRKEFIDNSVSGEGKYGSFVRIENDATLATKWIFLAQVLQKTRIASSLKNFHTITRSDQYTWKKKYGYTDRLVDKKK